MRLVDHQEAHLHLLYPLPENLGAQALGGEVEELVVAVDGIVEGEVYLPAGHAGMDGEGLDAPGAEILYLVLYQGDKGGHDDGQALPHHGRKLEAQRLSPSRRQDGQHVLSGQGGRDYLLLLGTERRVSPVFPQYFFHFGKDNEYFGKIFAYVRVNLRN